jgi:multimeric flavodoxin WrbA
MKVVGLVGSLRKGGNTEILVKEALKAAEEKGAETKLIVLYDKKIEPCTNCDKCYSEECPMEDDAEEIHEELIGADGIIIGSAVHFGDVTGELKCYLDRCVELRRRRGRLLKNKVGGSIAVGQAWGHARVLETLQHFMCAQSMIPVSINSSPGMGAMVIAAKKGEVSANKEGLKKAHEVGERVVEVINAMDFSSL